MSYHVPTGTYVVGDPCYYLSDTNYKAWVKQGFPEGVVNLGSSWMIAYSTGEEGRFTDSMGHVYGVDSCTIALIPEILLDPTKFAKHWKLGWVKQWKRPFHFAHRLGVFTIGTVLLDTNIPTE